MAKGNENEYLLINCVFYCVYIYIYLQILSVFQKQLQMATTVDPQTTQV